MHLLVVGRAAAALGQAVATGAVEVLTIQPATAATARRLVTPSAADEQAMVLDGQSAGAVALARQALRAGWSVLLTDVPPGDDQTWRVLAGEHGDRLSVSRPLRFNRLLMAAKEAIEADHIGAPRTIHLAWSFPRLIPRRGAVGLERDLMAATLQLADAALWLLAAEPERLYAWRSAASDSPMMVANIQCVDGGLISLEMTLGTDGFPPLRELSLYGLAGAIYHRAGHSDLLWSRNRADVLHLEDDGPARQMTAWLSRATPARSYLADGQALTRDLTLARLLRASLAGSMVAAS